MRTRGEPNACQQARPSRGCEAFHLRSTLDKDGTEAVREILRIREEDVRIVDADSWEVEFPTYDDHANDPEGDREDPGHVLAVGHGRITEPARQYPPSPRVWDPRRSPGIEGDRVPAGALGVRLVPTNGL